jgi:phage FluMu protein Com
MGMYEAAKDAANVLKEAGKIEEYKQILELLEKLLELQKRNADLEAENKNLEEKFKIKEKLEYKHNSYWNGEAGPYCSRCWEKNKELLRMHPTFIGSNTAKCPECETIVNFTGIKNSNSQDIRAARTARLSKY